MERDALLLGEWFPTFVITVDSEDNETSGPACPTTERRVLEDFIHIAFTLQTPVGYGFLGKTSLITLKIV